MNLIRKYIINIDALLNSDSIDVLARYLGTFNAYIEKRSLYDWVIYGDLFAKLLEWYFIFFRKYDINKEINTKLYVALFEIESSLTKLVEKCVLSSLQKSTSFLFFKIIKENTQGKDKEILR